MKEKTRRVIADMTKEIGRLKEVISNRDVALGATDATLRTTEGNLAAMATRVDELVEENRSLVQSVAELEEEKTFLAKQNVSLTNRAGHAATQRDNARHALDQVKAEKETLARQVESLEAKRTELADQLLRLRTVPAVSGPSAALDEVVRDAENHDVLRQAVDRLTTENERLSQRLDEEIKEANRLSFVVSTLTEESETLTGLVGRLRDAIFAAAAGLDVMSVEEGDPSLLEIVEAIRHAIQQDEATDDEVNDLVLLVVLLLTRLDECGYGGPQAFPEREVAGAVGKTISMERSAIDGRVIVALKPDEVTS